MGGHSASPTQDRRPLEHLAQYLREHSIADSSFRRYARAFSHWKQWTARRCVNWYLDLPRDRSLQLLSEFIINSTRHGCGSNQAVRSATVKPALLGISHFIRASGGDFPIDHPQIRMLLKGVARLDAPGHQKSPESVAILEACFHAMNLNDPAGQALWEGECLPVFFLLRRSEIMATPSTTFQWSTLNENDVAVIDSSGGQTTDPGSAAAVCIHLRVSKTNQNGKPAMRMLSRSGHQFLCPVVGAMLLVPEREGLLLGIPVTVFIDSDCRPGCVSAARAARALKQERKW